MCSTQVLHKSAHAMEAMVEEEEKALVMVIWEIEETMIIEKKRWMQR